MTRLNLGFTGETARIPDHVAAQSGLASECGVAVKSTGAESVAARAGLEVGDIITRICGEPVTSLGVLHRLLCELASESEVHLQAIRAGQLLEFMLKVQDEQDLSRRTA